MSPTASAHARAGAFFFLPPSYRRESMSAKRSTTSLSGSGKKAKAGTESGAGASDKSFLERIVYRSFHHHSARKNNCFIAEGVCEAIVLRSDASEEILRELSMDAADCMEYGERSSFDNFPGLTVNLGRFDGDSVLGQKFLYFIRKQMMKLGVEPEGKHLHAVAKSDCKYVTYRSRVAPSPGPSGIFEREWAAALPKFCSPHASLVTPPHRDSGVQNLNQIFVPGDQVTLNDDDDAQVVDYRAVMCVTGDDMGMLMQEPVHDDEGAHVDWAVQLYRLRPGDIFLFKGSTGAIMKHAAAAIPPERRAARACLTYVVFDLHVSDEAPHCFSMPPRPARPVRRRSACELGSGRWWPEGSAGPLVTEYWPTYREQRSAASFLSWDKQIEVLQQWIAIFAARRDAGVAAAGCLPPSAVAFHRRWTELHAEGRVTRGQIGGTLPAGSLLERSRPPPRALSRTATALMRPPRSSVLACASQPPRSCPRASGHARRPVRRRTRHGSVASTPA